MQQSAVGKGKFLQFLQPKTSSSPAELIHTTANAIIGGDQH